MRTSVRGVVCTVAWLLVPALSRLECQPKPPSGIAFATKPPFGMGDYYLVLPVERAP